MAHAALAFILNAEKTCLSMGFWLNEKSIIFGVK